MSHYFSALPDKILYILSCFLNDEALNCLPQHSVLLTMQNESLGVNENKCEAGSFIMSVKQQDSH